MMKRTRRNSARDFGSKIAFDLKNMPDPKTGLTPSPTPIPAATSAPPFQSALTQPAHNLTRVGASGAPAASGGWRPPGMVPDMSVTSGNRAVAARPASLAPSWTWDDAKANSGRVGFGILGALAGGLGNVGTGAVAGATNAWNALTPKSVNTPAGWTEGVNDIFNKSIDFTNASAADVYGGLGGYVSDDSYMHPAFKGKINTDYQNSRATNVLNNVRNAPDVSPTVRNISQGFENVGRGAWNAAQYVVGGNLAAKALKALPGANVAAQAYNKAVPQAVQRAATYATGAPLSNNVNPIGLTASMAGQGFANGYLGKVDEVNAINGEPTNWQRLLPVNWPYQAMSAVAGDDAANAASNLMYTRALGPGVISPAINLLGPTAIAEGVNALSPQQAAPTQAPDAANTAANFPAVTGQAPAPGSEPNSGANVAPPQQQPTATTATPAAQPAPTAQPGPSTQEQTAAVTNSMQAAAAPDAPPEVKQEAQQKFQTFMQQQVDANPKFKGGAADLVAGKNTPAAQEFRAHLKKTGDDVMNAELQRLYADNPNPSPQEAGGLFAQAQQAWHGLSPTAQVMVGLGATVGMVGLAMSMFGDGDDEEGGGILPMLMAILGLGGAALGAAGGGMFGQGAQNAVIDTLGGMGQSAGLIPKELTPEQKSILLAKDPIQAAIASGGGNMSREEAAKRVQAAHAQMGQLQQLRSVGGMFGNNGQARLFENMRMTPEEAALASKNMGLLTDAYSDPKSQLSQQLQDAQRYADSAKAKNWKDRWGGWALEQIGPQRARQLLNWVQGKQGNAHMNIAQQIYLQHSMMKSARCWAGYEPVPGSTPYSDGSCRPKGSKKTQKDMKEKKSASSVFKLNEKKPEAVVNGVKPSTEASKEVSVKREDPKKETDLRPEGVLPSKA